MSKITNLFVVIDESAPVVRSSIAELLKDAGVDYLDLRGDEEKTVPKLTEHDGPNWLLVDEYPEDLQGASTVWIGEGAPAEAATFNIDAHEKTTTQVINEVNDLVGQVRASVIDPEPEQVFYALWPEATDEGMLALTPAGELVLTQQPTVAHPDAQVARLAVKQWMERLQKVLDVPEEGAPAPTGEDDPEQRLAPAKLKYLNYHPADNGKERL